ncbi:MAG TPA: hypothetical protein VF629_18760 [Hymenobacter sp.]|uniref:hypothetical protein n=1 Tax=Hymenobacter sp. TaxID=1898978 RepID=UPI002EDA2E5E
MKKAVLSLALALAVAGSWAFYPKPAEPAGSMMVISNVSLGFDAVASIITVAPDGTQQEKAVEFNRGSAKKVAANLTEVHKATLATINQYTRAGWHVVSVTPSGLANQGSTFFSQSVYLLEK